LLPSRRELLLDGLAAVGVKPVVDGGEAPEFARLSTDSARTTHPMDEESVE
jgi:hypothetical protein